MKTPKVLALLAGAFALSACMSEGGAPGSTPSTVPTGDPIVHTPVVGLTTVTPKTDADNPY